MRSITVLSLIGFVVCIGACASATEEPAEEATTTEADVEALKGLEETVVAAFKAGEIDTFVTLYPDDVVLLPPNQPSVVGKKAALAWVQDFYHQFTVHEFTSPVDEVVVADDWAFARGAFSWILSPKASGEPVQDSGKFIVIWHRVPDGSWKRARVIWNSDNPPAGQ